MTKLVPPHGGKLNPLLVADAAERAARLAEAGSLPRVTLTSRELSDVIMLATGAFSPLAGFLAKADYERSVREMRLASGTLWPVPITLSVTKEEAAGISEGDRVALVDPDSNDTVVGAMTVEDKFEYDKRVEAREVFGTDDEAHPGVAKVYAQGEVLLGGPIEAYSEGGYPERFPAFARPAETRALFESKGWSTVAAFQTRNPIHRSHEYLTKVALEVCDGLFIHPIVGALKAGDIPAEVRMRCYDTLLANYYPADRVVLKVYPMEMRYAGPREALLHAIIRQNFGCSRLIVGRDHAGVGKYYGPFDAQKIFDGLSEGDLHLKPLKMDWTFWCDKCEAIVSSRTCPHPDGDHLMIRGTKLREMLAKGEAPPATYTRPEVARVLIDYYASEAKGGA